MKYPKKSKKTSKPAGPRKATVLNVPMRKVNAAHATERPEKRFVMSNKQTRSRRR